jgi:acyl-CoA synthetase (AMP-forming)/AMP-acid ligase II
MHAGFVAVPTAPPRPGAEKALADIAQDCKATAILTSTETTGAPSYQRMTEAVQAHGCTSPWMATEELPRLSPEPLKPPSADTMALIQYTSGSTREPRGVCVSFRNLQHQLAYERKMLGSHPDACYVFWLPHYHDFGLIAAIIGAAQGNGRAVLASPMTFLRKPQVWGEVMTRYQATHTAAPDLGYLLLAQRTTAEQRAQWDLSSLEVVASAAEPVRAATVDALFRALEPCGLAPTAFCPSYGLAEHTLGVSMWGRVRQRFSRHDLEQSGVATPSAQGGMELFGCGAPSMGVQVRIVDPSTRSALADGRVGEVWVDSPSKAMGYYGRQTETRNTFFAQIDGEPGHWLRTGDLAALVDGEIVITGRLKDMVILAGRNIYPQDVEDVVSQNHSLIRMGYVACFGAHGASGHDAETQREIGAQAETLVVVAELTTEDPTRERITKVCSSIRRALQQQLGIAQCTLALAKRGGIERTTSGKIRRRACRDSFLAGKIDYHVVDRGLGALGTIQGAP